MSARQIFLGLLLACFAGYCTGLLGVAALHYDESHHGASCSQYQFDWLSVFALPGSIAESWRVGYTWRVDEAWGHRQGVALWNAAAFGLAALPLLALACVAGRKRASEAAR